MRQDKIFLSLISLMLLVLSLGIFIRGKKDISISENRQLADFPKFSSEGFFDASFQKGIEDAFVDQMFLAESFKSTYNSMKSKNLELVSDRLKLIDKSTDIPNEPITDGLDKKLMTDSYEPSNLKFKLDISPKGNDLFKLEKSGHLMRQLINLNPTKELYKLRINNYNEIVKKYPNLSYNLFYIETEQDIDFINGHVNHELIESMYKDLDPKINKFALYLNTPGEYQKYFYKTDHHWNEEGQLKGYENVIRGLKGQNEKLLDVSIVSIGGIKYNGYKSREIDDYSSQDDFKILVADLKDHKTYINGEEKVYNKKQDYIEGNFEKAKGFNYYGDANGGDYGVVRYDFANKKEENLLVFVDSFSNPIKEFIASHYNNTYYVDLRDYENSHGHKFKFGEFVGENKIDKVLFMGYRTFFAEDIFNITD